MNVNETGLSLSEQESELELFPRIFVPAQSSNRHRTLSREGRIQYNTKPPDPIDFRTTHGQRAAPVADSSSSSVSTRQSRSGSIQEIKECLSSEHLEPYPKQKRVASATIRHGTTSQEDRASPPYLNLGPVESPKAVIKATGLRSSVIRSSGPKMPSHRNLIFHSYFSLLSYLAVQLKVFLINGKHVKAGRQYERAFTGKDVVDTMQSLIRKNLWSHRFFDTAASSSSLAIDRSVAFHVSQSLHTQLLFYEVEGREREMTDDVDNVYMFSDDVASDNDFSPTLAEPVMPLPTGVVTMLTRCYTPMCIDEDKTCYAWSCPKRLPVQSFLTSQPFVPATKKQLYLLTGTETSFSNTSETPPIHLLSMATAVDLQRAISDLYQGEVAQRYPSQEILQETLVQGVMEYLQAELDHTTHLKSNNHHPVFGTIGVYYKRCLWTLRQLSMIYKIFPASLIVQNVRQEGKYAVGGGGFADIYRGSVGRRPVCLKVLRLVIEQDDQIRDKIRKDFCNEALVWRQLKHPNVLSLLGVNAEIFSPSFCLISPWMENKDIITYLRRNPMHNRHTVLSEVAAGLSYLHSRDPPILHGDIRGANILVTDELHCCLADFGLAVITADSRTWSSVTTSMMTKGAIRWMAPELIIPHMATVPTAKKTSRDVYAFGCTILEVLTLQIPFHNQKTDPAVLYDLMLGNRPPRPQNVVWYPDPIWDLTTRCWANDAIARPNAQEIIQILAGVHSLQFSGGNESDANEDQTSASVFERIIGIGI